MLKSYFLHYAETYTPYKGGPVCYEDGLLYQSLINLYLATGEKNWLSHAIRLAEAQVDPEGNLKGYELTEYNIDNIMSGRAFLFLYKETKDNRYLVACQTLIKQLESHPRTKGGNYWHKKRYPYQVWLDGLWMGLPFQLEYARMVKDEVLLQDAIDQLMRALSILEVTETGLYAHGYDESREQAWANDRTGLSPAHWGRAVGWLSMALVDVISLVKTPHLGQLAERTQKLLTRILELQQPSGAWLQVMDQPDLPGNYEETSASAMFAYSLMKASQLQLGDHFFAPGKKALDNLEQLVLSTNPEKPVMPKICCVAGLGGFDGNYRDGSAHYYTTEVLRDDDIKGVSPLMLASAEYFRIEHSDQTKGAAFTGS